MTSPIRVLRPNWKRKRISVLHCQDHDQHVQIDEDVRSSIPTAPGPPVLNSSLDSFIWSVARRVAIILPLFDVISFGTRRPPDQDLRDDGRKKQTVAHVTTAHPVSDNRIFRKECAALAQAGFDVHLVAVAEKDGELGNVAIDALPRHKTRLGRMLRGPLDAWYKLHQVQPSLLHVHDPELIPLAILWKLRHHRPALFDAHEDLPKQVLGKPYIPRLFRRPVAVLAHCLERAADSKLDGIVAATPSIARNFCNPSVILVQNFPLLQDYSDPTPTPNEALSRFSYVGGIGAARGGREMIESISTSTESLRLTLAGPITAEMQTLISDNTSGRIEYLGILSAEQVPDVVRRSSAGLVLFHPLPNHLESQPTKLFEYMAAGRPFIASNFDSWRGLLEQFDCGFFVDPLNIKSIRDVMERIAANPDEAIEMGQRGRRAMVEHFTFHNESRRLVAMTTKLLAQ